MAMINSSISNTLLSGTSDDDTIRNGGYWYEGNEEIWHDAGSNVTINTGEGNDSVYNSSGDSVTINTGEGNDSVGNLYGSSVTINTGEGDDSIWNSSDVTLTSINTGAGNDFVSNGGSSVTINTGEGNDSVDNYGSSVTINTGAGNDYVDNFFNSDSVTINTGAGNDSVNNYGKLVTIDGGEGEDYINDWGKYLSINGGEGNDYISGGSGTTINGGNGDDTIDNRNRYNYYGTISGDAGNDSISNIGTEIIIDGGTDNDTIENYGSNVTVDGGADNDTIDNEYGENVLINAGAGNDSIFNTGDSVTIDGGTGNDTIRNNIHDTPSGGEQVSLNGGAGDDYINNDGNNSTLIGGTGNDTIENWGQNISLSGGEGNDYIINNDYYGTSGANSTIEAGAGNDSIYNYGNNVVFTYANGDGNDIIYGFNATSTLQIGGGTGTYSSQVSGSDIIVTVGDGKITLSGAASLSKVNIAGKENAKNTWNLSGTTATYGTAITITGVKSLSGISLSGKVVTIAASSLNASKVTISDGYTLALADDAPTTSSKKAWSLNKTTATYKQTSTEGYTLASDNKSISYTAAADKTLITVSGVKSTSGISLKDKVVTVAASSLNQGKVTISDGYTLALADDAPTTSSKKAWSLNKTTASYNQTTAEGYTLASDNKSISYTAAADKTLITVSGVKSTSGISLKDKVVTVAASSLNQEKVTVSDGYTLALADDAPTTSSKKAWSLSKTTATYKQTSTEGYTLASDNKSISYKAAADKTLITVSGVKSLKGISLSGKVVTIAAASLNQGKVTVSDGYTLALADDAPTTSSKKAWSLSKTTATYKQTSTEGYTLASDNKSISYTAAADKTLITVSGVKSLKGISLKDKVVTVAASSLNQGKVTISDGYTLALADDAPTTSSKKAWSLSGTTATYNQTSTAGYTLASDAKSINYTAAANKTLATVSGIKSTNGLSIDGKVITVSKAALGTNKVTVSDGYTLALAKNVTKTSTKKAWSLNKTTASYKQTNAAGYKLSNNVITYTKKAIKTLATVSGVKAINGLSIDGKIITVSKAALGTNKVTVSDGYTLALAKNVTKTSTKKAWSLNKTTASYKQTNAAGYKLSNNVITYTKKATKTLATVTGVKSTNGLSIDGKIITVSKAALGTNKVTVSDGYTLALAKNVTKTSTKKTWSLNKTTASYNQATTAGYKLAGDAKSISYAKKATKTLATVSGVKSTKGFTLSGETIELATTSLSSKVTVSSDDYGFDFASTYKKATITGSGSDDTITSAGQKIIINGGAGNDSIVNKGKNSTINAGAGNDTVVNSGADVMIRGGKGNDSLIGGKGNDIFVYAQGDGNDVITNYNASDRISIESSAVNVLTNGNNVVFTVGIGKNQGKITLQKAKGKTITYFVGDEEFVYPNDNVKYNAAGTAATLKAAYTKKKFEPSDYSNYASTLVTIDASAIKHTLKITGNDQANKITGTSEDDTIYGGESSDTILSGVGNDELHGDARNDSLVGGAGDDSLWGGKGSDTLFGGDGADTFIYQNGDGKDTIADFARGDVVMILSGKVGGYIADKSDVIFKIGTGQITFQNSVDKYIELVDKAGNIFSKYNPR